MLIKSEADKKKVRVVTTWPESGLPEADKGKEDINPWMLTNFRGIAGILQGDLENIEEHK